MDLFAIKIVGLILLLLIFSRRIFDLSLSLFLTSSTLMLSLLSISVSALILSIAAIPTFIVGCKIAHRHYADVVTPSYVVSICGYDSKTPRVVRSRTVVVAPLRAVPTSAPGKY